VSFKDVYGHEKQIKVLQTAISRDRIPHAYLFYGAEGVGKKTVAEVFAKALNCKSGQDSLDACDVCPSCLKIDHGNYDKGSRAIHKNSGNQRAPGADEIQPL
jgi:DNA polymerase III gamma/tau subunit